MSQVWWHTPVSPNYLGVEAKRIAIWSQPDKGGNTLSQKQNKNKQASSVTQVMEQLFSKHEVLESINPQYRKNFKKKERRREGGREGRKEGRREGRKE
jgi:hypothetical protein